MARKIRRTVDGSARVGWGAIGLAALPLLLGSLLLPGPGIAQEATEEGSEELKECPCARTFEVDELEGLARRFRGLEDFPERQDLGDALQDAGRRSRVFAWQDRGRLGIELSSDREERDPRGARISGVLEGSPADEAGLREGDIVTRFDGHELTDPLPDAADEAEVDEDQGAPTERLLILARELEPGDEVEVAFLRDGEERSVTVEAEEWNARVFRPRPGRLRARFFDAPDRPDRPRVRVAPRIHMGELFAGHVHGLELVPMNEGLAEYFGTDRGVLVASVDEDSELGLRPGDVLLRIGDREVEDRTHAARILSSYRDDEPVRMEIVREGERQTIEGRID